MWRYEHGSWTPASSSSRINRRRGANRLIVANTSTLLPNVPRRLGLLTRNLSNDYCVWLKCLVTHPQLSPENFDSILFCQRHFSATEISLQPALSPQGRQLAVPEIRALVSTVGSSKSRPIEQRSRCACPSSPPEQPF